MPRNLKLFFSDHYERYRPVIVPGPTRGLWRFIVRHKRLPKLRQPLAFSDKVLWKMRHDRRPILTTFCDKYAVRAYVAERIREDILTQLFGVSVDPEQIRWDRLPSRYAVKATHGSGWNCLVPDSSSVRKEFLMGRCRSWLKRNYFDYKGEWSYRDVTPRIMVEEFLCDRFGQAPCDYKVFCFDGKAGLLLVDVDRFGDHRKNFYSPKWEFLSGIRFGYSNTDFPLEKPIRFERMIEMAERLATGIDMVRVDLYNIDGRIVFGEMTNYPLAGARPFDPVSFDLVMGDKWCLPTRDSIRG